MANKMKLLDKYLFNSFSSTFFPIFLTLFVVTSIISLVRIAALTSVIQINFLELLQIYSYTMPTILFYTLPIAYFIGLALSIAKLSDENELIVITSFGLSPSKVLGVFVPISIIVTIILLITTLGLNPKAHQEKTIFIDKKKQEAEFNIKASEYGQQFGNWLIYVDKEKKQNFTNITLLQVNEEDTIISANQGNIYNTDSTALSFKLQTGSSFVISDNIKQIDFEEMILNHNLSQQRTIKSLNDIIKYWSDIDTDKKKKKEFIFNILISIFPLISLFFVLILGYYNPRYSSNHTVFFSSMIVIVYVALSSNNASVPYYTIPIGWMIISYILYHTTVRKLY